MIEDGDHSFPPTEEAPSNHINEEEEEQPQANPEENDVADQDQPLPIDIIIPEEHSKEEQNQQDSDTMTSVEDVEEKSAIEDQQDSIQYPISSSTEGDGETTGPSTAENSISNLPPVEDVEPKQVVGGRASIPDELEPHQLARLQDLKESNA